MKASEILHGLAELLGQLEASQETTQATTSPFTPVNQEPESVDQAGTFVPPLQSKLELLKKAVNVDSIYDEAGPDEDLTGQGADNEDELAVIKRMAGIAVHPVVADEAASDDPLDI